MAWVMYLPPPIHLLLFVVSTVEARGACQNPANGRSWISNAYARSKWDCNFNAEFPNAFLMHSI
jgi:hypothetical protein